MNQRLSLSQRGIVHLLAIVIGLGLLAVLAFSLNALFASRSQQGQQAVGRPVAPSDAPPTVVAQESSPTPTIATGQTNPTVNWNEYMGRALKFKYPPTWNLFEHQNGDYFTITDDKNHPNNEFRISIQKLQSPYGHVENPTVEGIIEDWKDYEMSSTANLAEYKPREISKNKVMIDRKEGVRYVIHLDNPIQLKYNQVTWIFVPRVPSEQQLTILFISGADQKTLDQILSTLKLTR